jgi:hypothetical protein
MYINAGYAQYISEQRHQNNRSNPPLFSSASMYIAIDKAESTKSLDDSWTTIITPSSNKSSFKYMNH